MCARQGLQQWLVGTLPSPSRGSDAFERVHGPSRPPDSVPGVVTVQQGRDARRWCTSQLTVQDHIDRYCHLIVFGSYLSSGTGPAGGERQPFAAFLPSYPEIHSVMDRLLWAFPLLTLELDGESGRDKLSDPETALEVCLGTGRATGPSQHVQPLLARRRLRGRVSHAKHERESSRRTQLAPSLVGGSAEPACAAADGSAWPVRTAAPPR